MLDQLKHNDPEHLRLAKAALNETRRHLSHDWLFTDVTNLVMAIDEALNVRCPACAQGQLMSIRMTNHVTSKAGVPRMDLRKCTLCGYQEE